jgi:hypothetical protein
LPSAHAGLLVRIRGDQNGRNGATRRDKGFEQLKPCHPGHAHVSDHDLPHEPNEQAKEEGRVPRLRDSNRLGLCENAARDVFRERSTL